MQAFSSCGKRGLSFIVVHGLLITVACRCGAQALERRLSSCGTRAYQLVRDMWDLPGPGLEPVSPELAGRFLTTVPPGKSYMRVLICTYIYTHLMFLRTRRSQDSNYPSHSADNKIEEL